MQASIGSKTPISTQTPIQSKRVKREAQGSMATIEDDDERLLAEIGYEQVGALMQISLDRVV
jgi:hypothetical protein